MSRASVDTAETIGPLKVPAAARGLRLYRMQGDRGDGAAGTEPPFSHSGGRLLPIAPPGEKSAIARQDEEDEMDQLEDRWWFVRETMGERRYVLTNSPACRAVTWTHDWMAAKPFTVKLHADRLASMQSALGRSCDVIELDCRN